MAVPLAPCTLPLSGVCSLCVRFPRFPYSYHEVLHCEVYPPAYFPMFSLVQGAGSNSSTLPMSVPFRGAVLDPRDGSRSSASRAPPSSRRAPSEKNSAWFAANLPLGPFCGLSSSLVGLHRFADCAGVRCIASLSLLPPVLPPGFALCARPGIGALQKEARHELCGILRTVLKVLTVLTEQQ